jgi:drug/metabolite transporter (DMT)-like permease
MAYKTKLIIALLLIYLIWGSTFLGVKVAIESFEPIFTSSIRFIVAGFGFILFSMLKGWKSVSRKQLINATFIGILLSGVGNSSLAYGIKYISTGIVSIIAATIPLLIFLFNYLFFERKKPSTVAIIGLLLGFLGMIILVNPFQNVSDSLPMIPILVIGMGTISWAYASLKNKELDLPKNSIQSAGIQMFAAGIFNLLISILMENNQFYALQHFSARSAWAIVYLIFIGSYIGYSAFLWLINNAPVPLVSTYAFVNPIVAFILGYLFLGEQLSAISIIASCIILIGVVLITIGNIPKKKGNEAMGHQGKGEALRHSGREEKRL